METNKKIVHVGIIIILTTMNICMLFVYFTKLKNPVFFKNYIEYGVYVNKTTDGLVGQVELELQCVTNVSDQRYISYVTFKEAPEIVFTNRSQPIMFGQNTKINGENYGRYSVRTTYLTAPLTWLSEEQDDIKLSYATIHMNNGEMIEADLGEIYLFVENMVDNRQMNMFMQDFSNNTVSYKYNIKSSITLEKITSPLFDKVSNKFEIDVDNNDYTKILGKVYHCGNCIKINTKIIKSNNDAAQYVNYSLRPKLYYKDREGNTHFERIYYKFSPSYDGFSYFKLFRYLKAKGEI